MFSNRRGRSGSKDWVFRVGLPPHLVRHIVVFLIQQQLHESFLLLGRPRSDGVDLEAESDDEGEGDGESDGDGECKSNGEGKNDGGDDGEGESDQGEGQSSLSNH